MKSRLLGPFVPAAARIGGTAPAAVNLLPLNPDKTQTTLSGLSSGSFMTGQLRVDYSTPLKTGAAIVAGSPFHCSEGSMTNATARRLSRPAGHPTSRLASTHHHGASPRSTPAS